MRNVLPAALLSLIGLGLAGCSAPSGLAGACPPVEGSSVYVRSINGTDVRVVMPTDEGAVLHMAKTRLMRSDGTSCVAVPFSQLRVGDALRVDVDAWAESYPVQGWPDNAVIQP